MNKQEQIELLDNYIELLNKKIFLENLIIWITLSVFILFYIYLAKKAKKENINTIPFWLVIGWSASFLFFSIVGYIFKTFL